MGDRRAVLQRTRSGGHAGDLDALVRPGSQRIDLPDQLVVLGPGRRLGSLELEVPRERLGDRDLGEHHLGEVADADDIGERRVQTHFLRHGLVDLKDSVVRPRVGDGQGAAAGLVDGYKIAPDGSGLAVSGGRGLGADRLEFFDGSGHQFRLGRHRPHGGRRFQLLDPGRGDLIFSLGLRRFPQRPRSGPGLRGRRHRPEIFVPEDTATLGSRGRLAIVDALQRLRPPASREQHSRHEKQDHPHLLHHTAPLTSKAQPPSSPHPDSDPLCSTAGW